MIRTAEVLALAALSACASARPAPASTRQLPHPLITAREPATWPTRAWAESTPEAQGMSSDSLAAGLAYARAHDVNIHSVLIVRNGTIVLDAYFYPFVPGARHDVASVTKSVTALLTGIAIDRRRLRGTSEPVIPLLVDTAGLALDPRMLRITIGDLLSMRPGMDCGFTHGEPELVAMSRSSDWLRMALTFKMVSEPGTRYGYCSPGYHLLSMAITKSTGENALAFGRDALFGPLGITDVAWPTDPTGNDRGWGDLQLEPRDMAKIGLLMLSKGRWNGRTVVSAAWVDSMTTMRALVNPHEDYGDGWWLSNQLRGLVDALGRGGQRITVIPSMNAVVIFTGGGFEPGDIGHFIGAAVRGDSALPPDSAAQRRLRDALASAARAPAPMAPAPLPPVAREISGRAYTLDANALDLRTMALEFTDSSRALVRLGTHDGVIVLPIGLDGDYRTAVDPASELLMAARGGWRADGKFALELNLLARINRFDLLFDFAGRAVTIDVNETTQLGHETWHGIASP